MLTRELLSLIDAFRTTFRPGAFFNPLRGIDQATESFTATRRCGFVIALALAGCASSPADTSDIQRFVERRALCDHFRGELPDRSETARMEEVINKANGACAGTDTQLKALKARYADDAKVMKKLKEYEDKVE